MSSYELGNVSWCSNDNLGLKSKAKYTTPAEQFQILKGKW